MKIKLTKSQETAVSFTGRNILVSAGAGTGKTRVLVERFLHFMISGQAMAGEILALTYTEKAANEMKSRILHKLGELGMKNARRDLESAYISTFHAFAARVLREHPFEAGLDPDFRVIESEESDFLKEQALDEVLERLCKKGNAVFDFLKIYGEKDSRDGVLKLFNAARHDGKTLAQFFELNAKNSAAGEDNVKLAATVSELFARLGEEEFARQWQVFYKRPSWDWTAVEDFKSWKDEFSRKRGKKGDTSWKDIKDLTDDFLASKIQALSAPWRERLEALALAFEQHYETLKKEKSFLDFEDLQLCLLKLFKRQDAISKKLLAGYRQKFHQVMVDEFQDTNPVQLELVELISRGDNLFLVGDFKQSIYGFRGAEPSLFLSKEKEFEDVKKGLRISLLENFRTQKPVLHFINNMFEHLWKEDGFPFESLIASSDEKGEPSVEFISTPLEENQSMDVARMREADSIAERILSLHEQGTPFGDIAVLFQAMPDVGLYEQALKKRGIPYYSLAGTGFYHQPEIRDMVSFLSFIENPLADIPLAAALRSPLFQVTDDTLFWLSHTAKANSTQKRPVPLFEGVKQIENIPQIPEIEKQKVRKFRDLSQELLGLKDRLKITELLDRILEKTGYELTVLADTQGVRRYANLKKMINIAREFETLEPLTNGAFLRILRRIETHEVRESEAQVEAEESGKVVRLLSIHRSKGLEFPVVFVADLARVKHAEQANWLKAESGRGYAIEVHNPESGDWEEPKAWKDLNKALNQKRKQEWKRLFYVATTRAKQRLILSGVLKVKKSEKETFTEMSSWMDWLQALPEELVDGVTRHSSKDAMPMKRKRAIAEKKVFEQVLGPEAPQTLEDFIPDSGERLKITAQVEAIMRMVEKKPRLPVRAIDLPVSAYALFAKNPSKYREVYEAGYPDETEPERNEEPEEEKISYADFGIAVHKVMELLNFQNAEESLGSIFREVFSGINEKSKQEAQEIFARFLKSPLFKQLQGAKRVYRELPFVINQRHGRIEGVIDVLFQDAAGAWHILDYKTAKGDAQAAEASGYITQIQIYAFAVSQILKILPKTGIIYYLKNEQSVSVPFDAAQSQTFGTHLAQLQEEILKL